MNVIVRTPPPYAPEPSGSVPPPARRRPRALAAAAIVMLVAGMGGSLVWRPASPAMPAPAASAAPPAVVGLGWIEPAGTVLRIAASGNPDAARVAMLLVEEGERVTAGQVLATLDSEAQRLAQLAQAEAQSRLREVQLARQRIDLANLLAARRAAVERATAELRVADAEHERLRSLVATSVTSRSAYDRAARDLALSGATQREADAALARAAAEFGGIAIDVAVVAAELEAAQADLATARAALDLTRIRAPVGGTVLAIKARAGERVGTEGLLELGATDRMRAVVEVYQTDIGRVRPGQGVTLRADALAGPIVGTVERLGHAVRRQTVINADPATATDARVIEVVVVLATEESAQVAALSRLQVLAVFAP